MQCHAKTSTRIILHHLICINTTSVAPLHPPQHKCFIERQRTGASIKHYLHYLLDGKQHCVLKMRLRWWTLVASDNGENDRFEASSEANGLHSVL